MIDINISKVCKSFGFDLVLNNIDITVQKGEKVGLIGTNGSGKSTILKIIAGQESIDSGSLSIRNNISIGYLSQIPEEKDIIVNLYKISEDEILDLEELIKVWEEPLEKVFPTKTNEINKKIENILYKPAGGTPQVSSHKIK